MHVAMCPHVCGCVSKWSHICNLVMRYEPQRRIWLFAMGHSAEFGYVHWARVQNLLMHHGATEHIVDHSAESH
jgi:hypothetical protein